MHHKQLIPAFLLDHKDWFYEHLSTIAFPIVGIILIIFAQVITPIARHLVGGAMLVTGLVILIHGLLQREYKHKDTYHSAVGIILLICAIIIFARHDGWIDLLCTMWGLYGIIFAVRDINEVLYRIGHRKRFLFLLLETAFTLVLSSLLLLHPGESHFTLHLRILGVEMILVAIQPENFHEEHHEDEASVHTSENS